MSVKQPRVPLLALLSLFISCWYTAGVSALVVLQYHHVSEKTPTITSVTPKRFATHLALLKEHKFELISLSELEALVRAGKSMPDKTAHISFDDGYRSIIDEAAPLLKKHQYPFSVFINSQSHDSQVSQYMSWDDLRKLKTMGAEIANHSDSHEFLVRLKKGMTEKDWKKRIEKEVDFAQARIKKEIGQASKVFAYPYGEYNVEIQSLLKQRGFIAFGQQSGPIGPESDSLALPRFAFGGSYGDEKDFLTKIYSLPFPQLKVGLQNESGAVLEDSVLNESVSIPTMVLRSPVLRGLSPINCFASGQGQINVSLKGSAAFVKANKALPEGRSRYNCTAQAVGNRFYWYSMQFLRY